MKMGETVKILTTGPLHFSSDQAKASTLPAALSQGPSKLLHSLSRANGCQVDQALNVPGAAEREDQAQVLQQRRRDAQR